MQADPDAWRHLLKNPQGLGQKLDRQRRRVADPKLTAIARGDGAHGLHRLLRPQKNGPRFHKKNFTRFGQGEGFRRAPEKADAQFFLEIANLARQRRLGNMQTLRGPGHVLLLGHNDEITEVAEFHKRSIPKRHSQPSNIVFSDFAGMKLITGNERTHMIQLRKSNERGHAEHGWLDSYHSFSFADYYDPAHTNFRDLRVINEDRVAPEMGFSMHPHRDMEIITYVVSGALTHHDSMGNTAVINPGDVQRISAGTGILHSEINESPKAPVHLLQIWIMPDQKGVKPAYAEKSFAKAETGRLHLVASKSGRDGSIPIHQDADLFLGKLKTGDSAKHLLAKGRHGWLQLVQGELDANGTRLNSGDAIATSEVDSLTISATKPSDFLLFDLN